MSKFNIIVTVEKDSTNFIRTIDSIYNQTFKDFNITVLNSVNDSNITNIIKRKDDNIKELKNDSIYNLINKTFNDIDDEYILFINSGDYVEINTLSILEKCTKKEVDIVRFQFRIISEISFRTIDGVSALDKILKYKYIENKFLYLYNTNYIKEYKFEDMLNSELLFIPYIIYNSSSVISIGDILYDHYEDYDIKEYEQIKKEAYDTLHLGLKLIKDIGSNNIKKYVAINVIEKSVKLKGEDYKNLVLEIKKNNLIDMISDKKTNLKKILLNINMKCATRLIKW